MESPPNIDSALAPCTSTPGQKEDTSTFTNKPPESKRKCMSSQELLCSPHQTDTEHIIILLMEDKLKHLQKLDKLDLLDSLHAEISQIISTYQTETETLKATTHKLRDDVTNLSKENKHSGLTNTFDARQSYFPMPSRS